MQYKCMPVRKSTLWLVLPFLSLSSLVIAVPPDPPAGKRWVLDERFSDEFNGTSLDTSKWNDHHPNWAGRPPGLFIPENVLVGGGYLMLKGGVLDPPQTVNGNDYDISCAAVTSIVHDASYGYYECRLKASQSTLSATFWLASYYTLPGPEGCGDKYGLELDIQECIGKSGTFSGSYFAYGMHSNSHFRYWDCSGYKHNLTPPSVNFDNPNLASAEFNTYGCWWRNASRATFYYNDTESKDMIFMAGIKKEPFDYALRMNLVTETYSYPWISLPDEVDLLDPTKNTTYYDWVRSYLLVDIDAVVTPAPYGVLPVFLRIDEVSCNEADWNSLVFVYSSNANENVLVTMRNGSGQEILRGVYALQPGLGKKEVPLLNSGILYPGEVFTVRIEYTGPGSDNDEATYTLPIAPPTPSGAGVVVFSEDFEGATVGATSNSGETMAGTQIKTNLSATGEVVAAPAQFTTASGNVLLVSVGDNEWARIEAASVLDMTSYTFSGGDMFKLEFDLYIPSTLARPVGEIVMRWKDSQNTNNGPIDDTYECLVAGVHRLEYTGTFPVDSGNGDFLPASTQPIIHFSQEGVAAADLAYIDNIRLVILPPRITIPTTIWGEDFDGIAIGTTSGNNQTLPGTDIQTANTLTSVVVAAPAGFTNASGNVIRLSTGANLYSALRSASNPIDLSVYNIQEGDSYSLSFDMYIPQVLVAPVGSVNYRWKGPGITTNGPTYTTHETQEAGVYHSNYTGTFPIDEGSGPFIPDNVRPFIRMDLDGQTASNYVYLDNINFQIGPNGTGLEGFELFENVFAVQNGEMGDDDNDGVLNWEEFARGGHPKNAMDQGYSPSGIITSPQGPGDATFTYSFVRRKDTCNGLIYQTEFSLDLSMGSWSEFNGTEDVTPLSDDYELVSVPISASVDKMFFRIKVTTHDPVVP